MDTGATRTKAEYTAYMNSRAWQQTRRRWIAEVKPKSCAGCDKPWGKGDHLHHVSYARLGQEVTADLVQLCEPCHTYVHDEVTSWAKLAPQTASALARRRQEFSLPSVTITLPQKIKKSKVGPSKSVKTKCDIRLQYTRSKMPQVCAGCDGQWTTLYLRSPKRKGNERLSDLVPLCDNCLVYVERDARITNPWQAVKNIRRRHKRMAKPSEEYRQPKRKHNPVTVTYTTPTKPMRSKPKGHNAIG